MYLFIDARGKLRNTAVRYQFDLDILIKVGLIWLAFTMIIGVIYHLLQRRRVEDPVGHLDE